ncbi:MAG TPA: ice-binding family protein [Thermoanaerobaculia bacterium]|nr:ice-binding family protein [Thermoanaerobaculia bacterium]
MKRMFTSLLAVIGIALLFHASPAFAQVSLNTAEDFGVLGGSAVTNTGATLLTGDVGVSPGSSITGFPPGIVIGTIHSADAAAAQAQTDLTAAYNMAAGLACPGANNLTGQNLGGMTLTPGVYCFDTSAGLTGTLTLDFNGDPNAFFLIRTGSTLTTASGSSVALIDMGTSPTTCPPNVFWQIGSSATFGTGSSFTGNVLALTSITLTTGAGLNGRALARNGAVTLDTNTVTACAAAGGCPTIIVSPDTLPDGTVGVAYNQVVSASFDDGGAARRKVSVLGAGAFVFTVTSGNLPPGLTLNPATGVISGIPTTIGTSNFTITATSGLCSGSRAYSIDIVGAAGASPAVPALDFAGLAFLAVALGAVALFAMTKMSS